MMEEGTDSFTDLRRRSRNAWNSAQLWLIVVFGMLGTIAAVSIPLSQQGISVGLEVNDVSPRDILAPYSLSYPSEILTQQERETAAQAVVDQYDPPDSQIARQQLEHLQSTLTFIESVRGDTHSSEEEKLSDLANLTFIELDQKTAQTILGLPEAWWDVVKLESLSVLEQVMRSEIRPDRLEEFVRAVPALVSISLQESQSDLVVKLVQAFVAPNTRLNREATEAQKEAARQSVSPVVKSFSAGETIVERGQVVTDFHIEALQEFGLLKPQEPWKDILIRGILVILLGSSLVLYAHRTHASEFRNLRLAATLSTLFVLLAVVMQAMIPGRTVLPYLFPAATLPMLLAVLFGPGMGVLTAFIIGALAGFLAPGGLEMALYASLGGVLAALTIGRAERMTSFLWAGLAASLASMVVMLIFRAFDPTTDLIGKVTLVAAGLASGTLSAILGLGLLLPLGHLLGVVTSLQLIELSRPDHPLLQLLLQKAPGTYQHSLQVANLAEQAAREIGANALLTRVGALYHDAGKALQPQFFIENQVPGKNAHDQLDPKTSAGVIFAHVEDGLDLARKYRLPPAIQAFILEHHGTMKANFQYHAAIKAAGGDDSKIDERDFTYPGPRPQSKETALVMLADSVEAKARANMPQDSLAINQLVDDLVKRRLASGQLDRTELTLKDLDIVRRSFVKTLKGIYHPRIRYPQAQSES